MLFIDVCRRVCVKQSENAWLSTHFQSIWCGHANISILPFNLHQPCFVVLHCPECHNRRTLIQNAWVTISPLSCCVCGWLTHHGIAAQDYIIIWSCITTWYGTLLVHVLSKNQTSSDDKEPRSQMVVNLGCHLYQKKIAGLRQWKGFRPGIEPGSIERQSSCIPLA